MSNGRDTEETFRRKIKTSRGNIKVVVHEGNNEYYGDGDLRHAVAEINFSTPNCRDGFVFSADPLTDLGSEMKTDLENLDALIESLEHVRFRLRDVAEENGVELPNLDTPEVAHQEEASVHNAKVGDIYVSQDGRHVFITDEYSNGEVGIFDPLVGVAVSGSLDSNLYSLVHRKAVDDDTTE